MLNQIKQDRTKMGPELRAVFVATLDELMTENQQVIALEADLGSASGFANLTQKHSQQLINVGISEANMMGGCEWSQFNWAHSFLSYLCTFCDTTCF